MRARPAKSATRSHRTAAKWPNASSAGASNTARCARPDIEALLPSLPTSCSMLNLIAYNLVRIPKLIAARGGVCPQAGKTPQTDRKTEMGQAPQIFSNC